MLREGASVPQQQIIRDSGKSRAKAHKDIKECRPQKQRAGMPTWKTRREALPTLNYTQHGFRLKDGRLHLAGGVVVTVVWSRELPAEPSSVRVYQDTLGHWCCSFVVPAAVEPLLKTGRVIGIDWGVRDHDALTVEEFRPKFLAGTTMSRKAADAAIGVTKQALIEMGRKHRWDVRLVHLAPTTMDRAHCDARAKHRLLGERAYTCTACEAVSSGDKNSARVMLVRAGLHPAGADGVRPPGALLQEAA